MITNTNRLLTKTEYDEFKEILKLTGFWSLPNQQGEFAVPNLNITKLIEARRNVNTTKMSQRKHIGTVAINSSQNTTLFKLVEKFMKVKTD